MPTRLLPLVAASLFLVPWLPASAQTPPAPTTAEEVIARYRAAIGADHVSAITTFIERGEIETTLTNPNLGNIGRIGSLNRPGSFQHLRYEFQFKRPNLRFNSTVTDGNVILALHGCDGKISWYIDSYLHRERFTPKPGEEHDCEEGFELVPANLRTPDSKARLAGQKKIGDRMTWEIKTEDPKSRLHESYYFDADTFLLLRYKRLSLAMNYSDYRDVGGITRPFTITHEDGNGHYTTTVRQVQLNALMDDARFDEPQLVDGKLPLSAVAASELKETKAEPPSISIMPEESTPPAATVAPAATVVTAVNFPNFTTCTLKELQSVVRELRGLKPATDQAALEPLLKKIGDKLFDTARNTPNLISHETVVQSQNGFDFHQEYDYLILTQPEGTDIALNEFRVDVKTGEKFRSDDARSAVLAAQSGDLAEARSASQSLGEAGKRPLSQGFATSWVHFYPHNQIQSAFRYLGEQKLDGRHTVVLAFAQKPQAVISPGLFLYQGKSIPMYFQGVAWFDPSDFRILRLRTDLLAPLAEVSLDQLTADIRFEETRITDVPSALFLPHDVTVTSVVGGASVHERHSYSGYRLFRARTKIVATP